MLRYVGIGAAILVGLALGLDRLGRIHDARSQEARVMRGETHHPQARPARAAVEGVRHLHQIEHTGESEWTPWIAIAGLFLFLLTIELLTFGIVEGTFHLLASAP